MKGETIDAWPHWETPDTLQDKKKREKIWLEWESQIIASSQSKNVNSQE